MRRCTTTTISGFPICWPFRSSYPHLDHHHQLVIITIDIIFVLIFYLNQQVPIITVTMTRILLSTIFIRSLQAACFYVPHWIWKQLEGGRLQNIVQGLNEVTPLECFFFSKSLHGDKLVFECLYHAMDSKSSDENEKKKK